VPYKSECQRRRIHAPNPQVHRQRRRAQHHDRWRVFRHQLKVLVIVAGPGDTKDVNPITSAKFNRPLSAIHAEDQREVVSTTTINGSALSRINSRRRVWEMVRGWINGALT